jgi:membrane protein YdbS with pleckstrin-like domain
MEQLRNVDGARRWYEHVLMLDETHAGARARLAAIRRTPAGPSASPPSAAPPERASAQAGTQPGQPKSSQPWISTTGSPRSSAPSAVPDNAAAAASDGTGFYAALKADANPLSRNAVALIDRLRLTSRPRVADYPIALMGLVLSAFVSLVLSFLMLWDALRGANVAPEAVALFTGAPLVVTCLSGFWILQRRATRYELGDGLLKATRGLVAKETVTYELFRVTRVGVYRGPVQRLFGSGTLTLVVEGRGGAAEEVKLVGLVPGRDLLRMQDDLRNLAQLLRQNALIKGIIT